MSKQGNFRSVTRQEPCPVCEGPDNCKITEDGGAVWCGRKSEGSVRSNGGGQYLHILNSSNRDGEWWVHESHRHRYEQPKSEKQPDEDYAAKVGAGTEDARLHNEQLAEQLGVSCDSLQALGVGYADIGGLCHTFPERNAAGDVIGINRRFLDNRKQSIGQRGLTYATDWDNGGSILLVEGGSDTAALMTMGCTVIGRPSNTGGVDLLVELLQRTYIASERQIFVIGENDRLKDGQHRRSHEKHGPNCTCGSCFPGRFGAVTVAKQLSERLGRKVVPVMPPDDAKDSRSWLNDRGEVEASELGAQFVKDLKPIRSVSLLMRTAGQLVDEFPAMRSPVIEGLIRKGETMNVIAASKFGKSWLMLLLAFCVACGPRKWLGRFWTTRGKVLYIDNELHEETSAHRLKLVAEALGLRREDWEDTLVVINLRGKLLDLKTLAADLEQLEQGEFSLIVLDAWYRFQPADSDENSNGDVMQLYNLLDRIAGRIDSAFACVHHASKGDQSGKAVTDVGAGAGAQSRAADCHFVMRQHEQDGAVVVDAALRSWAPMPPFCMRWEYPQWSLAEDLDPADIRKPNGRKKYQDAKTDADTDPDAFPSLTREEKKRRGDIDKQIDALEAYEAKPEGETASQIAADAGINWPTFRIVQAKLLKQKFVEECQLTKNRGAKYPGFRINQKGIGTLRQLRQIRQNGYQSDQSDNSLTPAPPLGGSVSKTVRQSEPPEFDDTFVGGQPA